MRDEWISTTSSTSCDNYNNHYWIKSIRKEIVPGPKIIIKKKSKKEKIHIFDIKDLDLKEVL